MSPDAICYFANVTIITDGNRSGLGEFSDATILVCCKGGEERRRN